MAVATNGVSPSGGASLWRDPRVRAVIVLVGAAALEIALLASIGFASPASAADKVHFEAAVLPLSPLKQRLAKKQGVTLEPEVATPLWGYLAKPEGTGPFAAVVLLHGCDSLPSGGPPAADWLTEQDYVTLQVDSLGPRNLDSSCSGDMNPAERVLDAYGAAVFLRRQPFVDGARLAVMGWSQGGTSALYSVIADGIGQPLGRPFRAAVAVSPWCGNNKALFAPLLILTGAADQRTPVHFCRDEAEARSPDSAPVEVIIYPGVHHAFTSTRYAEGRFLEFIGRKYWAQYDAAAAQDVRLRAKAFLARHLD